MKQSKTVKSTRDLIENINSSISDPYKKYHLISLWWWNYWLYRWDFWKNIWKRIARWKIQHIFDILEQNWNNEIETIKSDFQIQSFYIPFWK